MALESKVVMLGEASVSNCHFKKSMVSGGTEKQSNWPQWQGAESSPSSCKTSFTLCGVYYPTLTICMLYNRISPAERRAA